MQCINLLKHHPCAAFTQVGNITTESSYWGFPENATFDRPSYYIPTKWGTSDLSSSLSAAFSSSALVLRNTDPALAQELFGYAVDLYAAAKAYPVSLPPVLLAFVIATRDIWCWGVSAVWMFRRVCRP